MIEYTAFPNEQNCIGESSLHILKEGDVYIVQAFGRERRHTILRAALDALCGQIAYDLRPDATGGPSK